MTTIYDNQPLERVEYLEGTVYTGVASSDLQQVEAIDSIWQMIRRDGDSAPQFILATKGAEARQMHIERFLDSGHDFILLLDGDMQFPPESLERLRAHGLPCVSGLYFRRSHEQVRPIWFEDDPDFRWPMMPFRYTPERGRLYRLGATGFGIWLIHRSVFQAVAPLLKGEAFVWQDDMDVWPYDLQAVIEGREPLRVLRGMRDQVGADVRLGFFIRQAGITIWGDPDVMCGHYLNYPLGINDWLALPPEYRTRFGLAVEYSVEALRAAHREARDA